MRVLVTNYTTLPLLISITPFLENALGCAFNDDDAGSGYDGGVWTTYGKLDLDWYSTLIMVGANPDNIDIVYSIGKRIHSRTLAPYEDEKETTAADAIKHGYVHFSDLFTEEFMAQWNENLYYEIEAAKKFAQEHHIRINPVLR